MVTEPDPYEPSKALAEDTGHQPGVVSIIGIIMMATIAAGLTFFGTCLGLIFVVLPPLERIGIHSASVLTWGLIACAVVALFVGWKVRCQSFAEARRVKQWEQLKRHNESRPAE